jgi:hypothetical protein
MHGVLERMVATCSPGQGLIEPTFRRERRGECVGVAGFERRIDQSVQADLFGRVGHGVIPARDRIQTFRYACADAIAPEPEMKTDDNNHRIYGIPVASVYPMYVQKAEKKGRTKAEVDEIIRWLTGHTQKSLDKELEKKTSFEEFFTKAPRLNPSRSLITGVVCGVRVEEIAHPLMRELRYLDKLIDELAKGKAMEKILRKQAA